MNTTENNKLIAEFMGWKQCDPNDNTIYANPTNGALHSSDSDMRFYTSWDWLMPVIEKIQDKHLENPKLDYDYIDDIRLAVPNIQEVYSLVVEFIKELNYFNFRRVCIDWRETEKRTQQRGGGYINEVSVAKFRAIKTPLHLYSEWNIKVNKCNSLEEIQTLLKKDKNN